MQAGSVLSQGHGHVQGLLQQLLAHVCGWGGSGVDRVWWWVFRGRGGGLLVGLGCMLNIRMMTGYTCSNVHHVL